jgi:hypothetical protein
MQRSNRHAGIRPFVLHRARAVHRHNSAGAAMKDLIIPVLFAEALVAIAIFISIISILGAMK